MAGASPSAEPGERDRELDAAALRFDGARVDARVGFTGVDGDASELDESCDSNGCGVVDESDCGPAKPPSSDPNDGESSDEPNESDAGAGGSSSDG